MPLDAFGNEVASSAVPAPTPVPAPAADLGAPPQFIQPSMSSGVAPTAGGAVGAFVLGIFGLWINFLGPWAWIRARRVLQEIDDSQGAIGGRGLAVAGKIMGMIGTFFCLMWIIAIVAVIATGSSTNH